MNIKKLIITVAFALGAWMSVGVAQAQTSYNFSETYTGIYSAAGNTYYVNGQFSTDNIGNITGWSNLTFDTNPTGFSTATYNGYMSAAVGNNGTYSALNGFNDASFSLTSASLLTPVNSYGTFPYFGVYLQLPQYGNNLYGCNAVGCSDGFWQIGAGQGPTVTPFISPAAPEIDGSLAPKVGFLLGCLLLMFGRKKQNTEALLTA
jgi:hypothetical protein